jgi:hypothetical protein
MVELLDRHDFEVISCDGNTPGCHDLDRARLLKALTQLELRAARRRPRKSGPVAMQQ